MKLAFRLDSRGDVSNPLEDYAGRRALATVPLVGTASGERRQLTILFVDLVEFTAMSTRLDPEDLQETTTKFFDICRTAIQHLEGYLAKFLGDGVLAYFGWPRASEDAAERAIRAAIAIRDAASGVMAVDGTRLAVRCGVATGLAVVGSRFGAGEIEERLVMGETLNLAARLQMIAPPDGIVVSGVTRRLSQGSFQFERVEPVELKGLGWQNDAALVVGTRSQDEAFEARVEEDAAYPLLGRNAELREIEEAWSRAQDGVGQIVGIVGEPGIGKSRLAREARGRVSRAPHFLIRLAGSALHRDTPFQPVIEWLRSRVVSSDPSAHTGELRRLLVGWGMEPGDAAPLVAELMGWPTEANATSLTLAPDQRRSALIAALAAWVAQISERLPTLLLVEDLHWLDASTLELLQAVVDASAHRRLLLLFTSREPFSFIVAASWRLRRLVLNRMSPEALGALVAVLAGDSLDARIRAEIMDRSDGIPLFAEELTRLMVARGEKDEDRPVPASLADLLSERIDGLGEAKRVVQLASVLGARFDLLVLERLGRGRLLDVIGGLGRALELEVVLGPRADSENYRFRHALLRDAAYNSLLRRDRRDMHREAAVVLRDVFPDRIKERPEVLAWHWHLGGEPVLAIDAWGEAGRLAMNRRALIESEHAYEQALAIVRELPAGHERTERELGLMVAYFQVVSQLHGYSGPKTRSVQGEIDGLTSKDGSVRDRFNQVLGRWMVVSSSGDHDEALTLADQLLVYARSMVGTGAPASAYMALMTSRLRTGDLRGAEAAFSSGELLLNRPSGRRRPGLLPQVYGNAANLARMLGNMDNARARLAKLRNLSLEASDPFELTYIRFMLATPLIFMGHSAEALNEIRQVVALADTHGYKQFQWQSRIILGRLQAELDEPETGLNLLREALDKHLATGSRTGLPFYLLLLAQAQVLARCATEALATLDRALGINPREIEPRLDILLLRGDLHWGSDAFDNATHDYSTGFSLSVKMGSALHEMEFRARLDRN